MLLVVGVWNANTAQPGISLVAPYLSLIIGSRMLPRMPHAGVGGSVGGSSRLREDL
jgi:hypothetical protein